MVPRVVERGQRRKTRLPLYNTPTCVPEQLCVLSLVLRWELLLMLFVKGHRIYCVANVHWLVVVDVVVLWK